MSIVVHKLLEVHKLAVLLRWLTCYLITINTQAVAFLNKSPNTYLSTTSGLNIERITCQSHSLRS